jgi:hypothetical protein
MAGAVQIVSACPGQDTSSRLLVRALLGTNIWAGSSGTGASMVLTPSARLGPDELLASLKRGATR